MLNHPMRRQWKRAVAAHIAAHDPAVIRQRWIVVLASLACIALGLVVSSCHPM